MIKQVLSQTAYESNKYLSIEHKRRGRIPADKALSVLSPTQFMLVNSSIRMTLENGPITFTNVGSNGKRVRS